MTLHHEIHGPDGAPPVLFAGSLGTTLEMWAPQVAALSDTYRTIAYDQLGHGRSPVPDGPYSVERMGRAAIALMDSLGVGRASFVGLSIGGMVGQWLASHAPERVDRLVLLCTAAQLPRASAWHDRARTVREAGTVGVIAEAVVERWVTPEYADANPERVTALRAMLSAQPVEGYAACCEAIAAMDQRDDLGLIAAPTLILGGAQDLAIPVAHQFLLANNIPDARVEVLDPGAHIVSIERADDVTHLIRHHLEATPS